MPMPVAISCLHPGLKAILEREARHIEDPQERRLFEKLVTEAADCPKEQLLGVELTRSSKRARRAPSAYNKFVQACRLDGKDMAQCAKRWKALTPEQQERYKQTTPGKT